MELLVIQPIKWIKVIACQSNENFGEDDEDEPTPEDEKAVEEKPDRS